MASFTSFTRISPSILKPKCMHSSNAYTEVLKSTVTSERNPISNSRIEKINNFKITKTKEIKVPALKCLDCGEIREIKHNQQIPTGSTYTNTAFGYETLNSCGNNNIAFGEKSFNDFENEICGTTRYVNTLSKKYKIMTEEDLKNSIYKQKESTKRQIENLRNLIEKDKKRFDSDVENLMKSEKEFLGLGVIKYSGDYSKNFNTTSFPYGNGSAHNNESTINKREVNLTDFIKIIFHQWTAIDNNTVDGVDFYDITFPLPIKPTDPKLDMFEGGGVLKWENYKESNGILGFFEKSKRMIKVMRIEKTILDKWFENRNKKDEDKLG